jgi:two-component system invasion response regulator UvrY
MINILIVDEQELVRTGLRHILERCPEVNEIQEVSSGEKAIAVCKGVIPDIVLIDISLPGMSAFEITRRIRRMNAHIGIIVIAVHAKAPYPNRLLDAGASGYLTKDCDSSELIEAVKVVAGGGRYLGTEAAKQLALSVFPGRAESPFEALTGREMEILLKLTEGTRVPDIASLLCLSPKTVATYKYRIYEKLGTRTEVGLLRMAMRYGLLEAA